MHHKVADGSQFHQGARGARDVGWKGARKGVKIKVATAAVGHSPDGGYASFG